MTDTKSLLMGAVPGVAVAIMLVLAVPGSALVGTQVTTDSIGPHGYVTVSVVREGQEIYRHEDHNLITDVGRDFISQQIGGETGLATEGAHFIALSSTDVTPAASDTSLAGEIDNGGGLDRADSTYAHTTGEATFTITNTFEADQEYTNVRSAGLFTDITPGGTVGTDEIMMAINEFTPVSLAANDELTITWTITLS